MTHHHHQVITGLTRGADLDAALCSILARYPVGSAGLLHEQRIAVRNLRQWWPQCWCRTDETSTFTGWLRVVAPLIRTL